MTDCFTRKTDLFLFLLFMVFLFIEPYTYYSIYTINLFLAVFIIILFVTAYIVLLKGSFISSINKRMLFWTTALCIYLVLSKIIHMDESNYYFELVVRILCGFYIATNLSIDEAKRGYILAMRFLAIYSVIATYSVLSLESLQTVLPEFRHYSEIYSDGYISFKNAFFCNVLVVGNGAQPRNYGIFREPGVYSIYLVFAAVIDLLDKRKTGRQYLVLILWNIVVLSTFSVMAIMSMFLIDICFFLKRNIHFRQKIVLAVALLASFGIVFYNPIVSESMESAFSKLNGGGSFDSRWGSLVGSIYAWLSHPVSGWGYTGVISGEASVFIRKYTDDYTNTTFLSMAFFGTLYGIINTSGLYNFLKKNKVGIIGIICVFATLNTQEMLKSSLLFAFVLYGLTFKSKKELESYGS